MATKDDSSADAVGGGSAPRWPVVRSVLGLHAASGLRIGLRRVAPLVVVLVAVPVYLGPATVETLVRLLFPSLAAGSIGGALLWQLGNVWALLAAALVLGTVTPACAAIRADTVGSLRALSFGERERLWASHLAAALVGAPLALWYGVLALGRVSLADGAGQGLLLLAPSLALLLAGAGGAAAHGDRRGRMAWSLVALLALQVSVLGVGLAAVLGLWAHRAGGEAVALGSSRSAARSVDPHRRSSAVAAGLLPVLWNLRAVPIRRVASAYLGALLVATPALLFLVNNELPDWAIGRAVVFAGGAASVALVHTLFEAFVEGRPPLRWERTLAWSCGYRVGCDLAALAALLLPVLIPVAYLRPGAVPTVLAVQLTLAVRWSSHLRAQARSVVGSPGQLLVAEGALVTLAAAVIPGVTCVVALLALGPLANLALRAERELRVSNWRELSVASERG